METTTTRCPYCECEQEGEQKAVYEWEKVRIYKHGTMKASNGIAIKCAYCHRTVSVMPLHVFFRDVVSEEF